jgi:hypothetical protein
LSNPFLFSGWFISLPPASQYTPTEQLANDERNLQLSTGVTVPPSPGDCPPGLCH